MEHVLKKRFVNYVVDAIVVFIFTFFVSHLFDLILMLVQPIFLLLYYFILESIFGVTVGKILTKTRVEFLDDSKSRVFTIFIRTISRIIPLEPISIILSDEHIMWHDSISKTRIVDK